MTSIAQNISKLKGSLPEEVTLIAVSKKKPVEALQEAYDAGQRAFGENYIQELVDKQAILPTDIEWHFIGHLQSNKVKYIAPFVHLIHGVDSLKLLKEINKQGLKNDRIIPVLLQFHIAEESTKFGLNQDECEALLNNEVFAQLENVKVCGLMGMASFTDDKQQVQSEFEHLASLFKKIKLHPSIDSEHFQHLSMGMSGDYPIAIEAGATLVRVGSAIFGARN